MNVSIFREGTINILSFIRQFGNIASRWFSFQYEPKWFGEKINYFRKFPSSCGLPVINERGSLQAHPGAYEGAGWMLKDIFSCNQLVLSLDSVFE